MERSKTFAVSEFGQRDEKLCMSWCLDTIRSAIVKRIVSPSKALASRSTWSALSSEHDCFSFFVPQISWDYLWQLPFYYFVIVGIAVFMFLIE